MTSQMRGGVASTGHVSASPSMDNHTSHIYATWFKRNPRVTENPLGGMEKVKGLKSEKQRTVFFAGNGVLEKS
ncbi:hypothetical protein PoB_002585600 [Plakobranchus ocellatus]|uniref:Uncharacterized protein n=1 Tax=Plakobranchus ocellatus TaxID=259542 RepID=A0AAV3ZJS2_9GAST|nr:hypothetical protein PoB_002585600 [Plakobranchus ocellatus]